LLATKRDRDQLWAEAVEAYQRGERWHLERNEARELEQHQERYRYEDPWLEPLRVWLEAPVRAGERHTTSDLLSGPLAKDIDRQTKGDEMRVGSLMQRLGWVKARTTSNGQRVRCWVKVDE
jgi:predicted P-loop ATPase